VTKQQKNQPSGQILMNQTRGGLSNIWNNFQTTLFPWLQEELGELTDKQKQLAEVETHLPYVGRVPGRPLENRSAIARAFVAKAVYNLPTTEVLLDQLVSNIKLRRALWVGKEKRCPQLSHLLKGICRVLGK
jgi:hypothetical protein